MMQDERISIESFGWGRRAVLATVTAQAVSGIGLCFYTLYRFSDFRNYFKLL